MHITVCVCTRDRGPCITATIRSLLASDYRDFDAIIVDQSVTDDTEQSVRAMVGADARFQYIRSATVGLSHARNIAVENASSPLIAFTDDDCEVAPDWLRVLNHYFDSNPTVDVICGAVMARNHDPSLGYVPTFNPGHMLRLKRPWLKWRGNEIGANYALRLSALKKIGQFDELLGVGATFGAGEDNDYTYRALAIGSTVLLLGDAKVFHNGFRNSTQGRALIRTYSMGAGAAYMKHLRLGEMAVLPTLLIAWIQWINWRRLLTMRRANGIGNFIAYARGMLASFHYGVDRHAKVYRDPSTAGRALGVSPPESAANLRT